MKRNRGNAGFTFIEMIVVVSIIGLLLALVGPRFIRGQEKAEARAAAAQIENIGTALDTFRLDVGRYPSTQEGLAALMRRPPAVDRWDGPYLKKDIPADPWGRPYYYRSPGEAGRPYDVYSLGSDGAPGGDGPARDVLSWDTNAG
ncbi:MAG TPA: type II secretion system major pseudopilin GspG [Candidatus Eisenbacteria bacterium]|nr:type II secretion system major pseudopilin GspG [Candidatus Eisenbacteria bacterium]